MDHFGNSCPKLGWNRGETAVIPLPMFMVPPDYVATNSAYNILDNYSVLACRATALLHQARVSRHGVHVTNVQKMPLSKLLHIGHVNLGSESRNGNTSAHRSGSAQAQSDAP
jgi:hypothetical protein